MKRTETDIQIAPPTKSNRTSYDDSPHSCSGREPTCEHQEFSALDHTPAKVVFLDLPINAVIKILHYLEKPQSFTLNWTTLSQSSFPSYNALASVSKGPAWGLQLSCSALLCITLHLFHTVRFRFDDRPYYSERMFSDAAFNFFIATFHPFRNHRKIVLPPLPAQYMQAVFTKLGVTNCETICFRDRADYQFSTFSAINTIPFLKSVDVSFPSWSCMQQLIAEGLPKTTELTIRKLPVRYGNDLLVSFCDRASSMKRALPLTSVAIYLVDDASSSGLINVEQSEAYFDNFFRILKSTGRKAFKGLEKLSLSFPLCPTNLDKIKRSLVQLHRKGNSFLDHNTELELIYSTHSIVVVPSLTKKELGISNRFLYLGKLCTHIRRQGLSDSFIKAVHGARTLVIESLESLVQIVALFKELEETQIDKLNLNLLVNIPICAVDMTFALTELRSGEEQLEKLSQLVKGLSTIAPVFAPVGKISMSSEIILCIGKPGLDETVVETFFHSLDKTKQLVLKKLSDLTIHKECRESVEYLNELFERLPYFMRQVQDRCVKLTEMSLQTTDVFGNPSLRTVERECWERANKCIEEFRKSRGDVIISDVEAVLEKHSGRAIKPLKTVSENLNSDAV